MNFMKYLLKQNKEDKGILCDKVTINGFDYYVSDELPKQNDAVITAVGNIHYIKDDSKDFIEYVSKLGKVLIATNNQNIDLPKVVDEVEVLAILNVPNRNINTPFGSSQDITPKRERKCFIKGYNKCQETHPFSEEDMTEFGKFCGGYGSQLTKNSNIWLNHFTDEEKTTKELLQLWKEQQPKIVYYE